MTEALLVPCTLEPTEAVFERGVEMGVARDDNTGGKEETGRGVEAGGRQARLPGGKA